MWLDLLWDIENSRASWMDVDQDKITVNNPFMTLITNFAKVL